jgi:hypothetical protein
VLVSANADGLEDHNQKVAESLNELMGQL